jgi:hypothetical protein
MPQALGPVAEAHALPMPQGSTTEGWRGTVRAMFDSDLAALYGVETRVLVQAIKRNLARFPMTSCFSSRPRNSCA